MVSGQKARQDKFKSGRKQINVWVKAELKELLSSNAKKANVSQAEYLELLLGNKSFKQLNAETLQPDAITQKDYDALKAELKETESHANAAMSESLELLGKNKKLNKELEAMQNKAVDNSQSAEIARLNARIKELEREAGILPSVKISQLKKGIIIQSLDDGSRYEYLSRDRQNINVIALSGSAKGEELTIERANIKFYALGEQ